MKDLSKPRYSIDNIGLALIGVFCLCYAYLAKSFAEAHIQIPSLDFPIFIGEILILLCLILAGIKCACIRSQWKKWYWGVLLYSLFVVSKALYGYAHGGALALRDAALFYYPIFFVFGTFFYQREFFKGNHLNLFVIIFLTGLIIDRFPYYYALTWLIFSIVLISAYTSKYLKSLLFLVLILFAPYKPLFDTARMLMVGNMVAFVYLAIVLFLILQLRPKIRLFICFLFIIALVAGFYIFPAKKRIRTIVNLKSTWQLYIESVEVIESKKDTFKVRTIPIIRIYNPEGTYLPPQGLPAEYGNNKNIGPSNTSNVEGFPTQQPLTVLPKEIVQSERVPMVNNSVFRLLIWRDMLADYVEKKPFFGIDFGRPLRSISLEVLNVAEGEWGRDGWISPHNSYFNMIYRAGIVGFVLVIGTFFLWFKMAQAFVQMRSVQGILLCSLLISWLMAANFGNVLEVPYTAIPIWSVYGVVFGYWRYRMSLERPTASKAGSNA